MPDPQARRVLALPFDHPLFHGTPGTLIDPLRQIDPARLPAAIERLDAMRETPWTAEAQQRLRERVDAVRRKRG